MLEERDQSRLRSLAAMARALSRPVPLLELVETAAEETRRVLGAASASVTRLEPDGLRARTLVNVGDLGPEEERWPVDEVYPLHELYVFDDGGNDAWVWSVDDADIPAAEKELLERLHKGCSIAAAISVDGRLWGELYATRVPGAERFDGDDVAYLEGLRAILAGAVLRTEREESLTQLAYRDPLTGLLNRRALDERADGVFRDLTARPRTVTAVAMDINGLKRLNDEQGHLAGDRLITEVARRLEKSFSELPGAVVARVGGDEFTVLAADVDGPRVVDVADAVTAESWSLDPQTALSCGAAVATLGLGSNLTPSALFANADRALYVAKRQKQRSAVLADPIS